MASIEAQPFQHHNLPEDADACGTGFDDQLLT